MKITFIAQSGFIIELNNGKRIGVDLWLQNPLHPITMNDVPKLDYVFNTHDHGDHDMKSCIELAKRDDAWFTSGYGIVKHAMAEGLTKAESGNVGGFYKMGDDLEVQQTLAHHSSDTGRPVGFIIKTPDGVIYHMGDTGYFSELKQYGEWYDIDVLMIPIGSRYTMDAFQASYAVADLKPKVTIPIHYNTSPKIQQDPELFKKYIAERGVETDVRIMEPGETINV